MLGRAPPALLLSVVVGGDSARGTRRSGPGGERDSSKCVACALSSEDVLLGILVNLDDVTDVATELVARGLLISGSRRRCMDCNCPWAAVSASEARLDYPNRLQPRA